MSAERQGHAFMFTYEYRVISDGVRGVYQVGLPFEAEGAARAWVADIQRPGVVLRVQRRPVGEWEDFDA